MRKTQVPISSIKVSKTVYQLEGGIIEYARQIEQEGLESKFIGKNLCVRSSFGRTHHKRYHFAMSPMRKTHVTIIPIV